MRTIKNYTKSVNNVKITPPPPHLLKIQQMTFQAVLQITF